MISRVADHCFWFGRYLERAESTARVLGVTATLATDAGLTGAAAWQPVLIVSGEEGRFLKRFGPEGMSDAEGVQRYMTWDAENLTSVQNSVAAARSNARSIREVLSLEAWEAVNELHLWLSSDAARAEYESDRFGFYRRVRNGTALCLGLLRSTMLHDTPLEFMRLGVILERAGQTARILDVHHHLFSALDRRDDLVETAVWQVLLRACSAYEPFTKRHPGLFTGAQVAAFLFLEPQFPRSIRYAVRAARDRLAAIRPPSEAGLPGAATWERLVALDAWVDAMADEPFDKARLHERLTRVVDETTMVCVDLGRELFGLGG